MRLSLAIKDQKTIWTVSPSVEIQVVLPGESLCPIPEIVNMEAWQNCGVVK